LFRFIVIFYFAEDNYSLRKNIFYLSRINSNLKREKGDSNLLHKTLFKIHLRAGELSFCDQKGIFNQDIAETNLYKVCPR
jgi:hypothetical protein